MVEIDHIVDKLNSIIELHQNSIRLDVPTIGISSPFADQVKMLKKVISQKFQLEQLKRHKVLIGTPFHFQGEERDIMLLSFCVDNSSTSGTLNYLNRSDVFNVLITRAKNKQFIYTSVKSNELPANSLLKEYIESCRHKTSKLEHNVIYDSFYAEVKEFLADKGFNIIQQSTLVSGILIDLVVIHDNKCFCIDLIGYPGDFEDQFSLEDLRILNRVQAPIFFLPYSSWYIEQEKTKNNLIAFFTSSPKNKS